MVGIRVIGAFAIDALRITSVIDAACPFGVEATQATTTSNHLVARVACAWNSCTQEGAASTRAICLRLLAAIKNECLRIKNATRASCASAGILSSPGRCMDNATLWPMINLYFGTLDFLDSLNRSMDFIPKVAPKIGAMRASKWPDHGQRLQSHLWAAITCPSSLLVTVTFAPCTARRLLISAISASSHSRSISVKPFLGSSNMDWRLVMWYCAGRFASIGQG
jgi:hypothetical protein